MTREWTSPDGRMRLINGCCMDFMRGCRDGEFDLACVDPPYGIGMDNSNKRTKPSRPNSYTDYPDFRYHNSEWDGNAPSDDYFSALFRVSQNQIVWGANYFCARLPEGSGWIFWDKDNGLDNCFSDGEFAFSSKGVQSRYFKCSAFHELRGGKDRIHPTQKPVALYRWLFQNYAKPGDRILDTHVGSASSFIAAWEKGFEITGCELDGDYFDAAVARIEKAMQQPALPFDTPPQPQHTSQELF